MEAAAFGVWVYFNPGREMLEHAGREKRLREEKKEGLMQLYDLSGLWQADIGGGKTYPLYLPGTLDESGIGKAQETCIYR